MGQAELLIAGLLVAVAGLSALARHLSVPYPIVLVVGGALFGFVPGLHEVELNPELARDVLDPKRLVTREGWSRLYLRLHLKRAWPL